MLLYLCLNLSSLWYIYINFFLSSDILYLFPQESPHLSTVDIKLFATPAFSFPLSSYLACWFSHHLLCNSYWSLALQAFQQFCIGLLLRTIFNSVDFFIPQQFPPLPFLTDSPTSPTFSPFHYYHFFSPSSHTFFFSLSTFSFTSAYSSSPHLSLPSEILLLLSLFLFWYFHRYLLFITIFLG